MLGAKIVTIKMKFSYVDCKLSTSVSSEYFSINYLHSIIVLPVFFRQGIVSGIWFMTFSMKP
jgi:hypothetical protein